MKFTVDLEEFWLDEGDLTSQLESHIKTCVVNQISQNIKGQVEKQIFEKVNETIDHKISLIIDSVLTDLVTTGVITRNGKEISIQDHIKDIFQKNTGWDRPTNQMERIAKKFGDELKLQYNNVFANKIVSNMKDQGLLKNDVVRILLDGK